MLRIKIPPPFPARRRRAFSLIETVVALGIFAVATAGLMGLLPLAFQTDAATRRRATAGRIAENLLAELSAFGGLRQPKVKFNPADSDPLRLSCDADGQVTGIIDRQVFRDGSPTAVFLVTVSAAADRSPCPGLAVLDIGVEWPGAAPRRNRHRQSYRTLLPCL